MVTSRVSGSGGPTVARALAVAVILVVSVAGCSSSGHPAATPSTTAGATTTTAQVSAVALPPANIGTPATAPVTTTTAAQWVVRPQSCGALVYGGDGNAGPLTCPDGRPNAAAIAYYAKLKLRVTTLGADASPGDVESAVCADHKAGHSTNEIEQSAYNITAAVMDWHFAVDPSTVFNGDCPS